MSRRGFFSLMLLGVLIGQGAADSLRAEPRSELTFREITSFDGVPLNVVESGNPAGSPIVFLHGFSQSYLSFLAQLQDPQLVSRHRLIAVDLRGHGASGKPWLREAYAGHLPWARDVRAVVDALQLAAPVIVGWSFGGFVAMDYVREYGPQSVTALLLTGSHGGLLPRPAGVPPIYAGDLDAAIRNAQQFMRLMSVKPVSAADIARGEFSHVMMPAYVRNAMAGKRLDNADLLATHEVRTLLLLGEKDGSLPAAQIREALRINPRIEVQTFEGVGHSAFLEEPARFNRTLAALADSASSSARLRAMPQR